MQWKAYVNIALESFPFNGSLWIRKVLALIIL